MYKITIKAQAQTDHKDLSELDGVDCQDCFSEYFDDDASYLNFVTGGYMRFKYKDGKLWTITEYESSRELTKDELDDLGEYTQGQWSDGIGEGFEQSPCMYDGDDEVYISPWFGGQEIEVSQVKI